MAAPNLLTTTTVTGKTAVANLTVTATAIVTNTSSSGKLLKVIAMYISNINGTSSASATIDFYRSSAAYEIASTVSVPANSTLDLISKNIYLEEGDSLRVTASANSYLRAVCSYEEVS
jgi:hypothetical protein